MSNSTSKRPHTLQLLPGDGFFLDVLDFGDVFHHGKSVEGLAIAVANNGRSQVDPKNFPALLQISFLDSEEGDLAPKELLGQFHIRWQVIGMCDVGVRLVFKFRLRIPNHLTQCVVDFQEAVVPSNKCETQRTFFENPAEALLTFSQCCLSFLALSNIEIDTGSSDRPPGIVGIHRPFATDPVCAPIGPTRTELDFKVVSALARIS